MIQSISDVLFGHIQKYRMVAVESDIESVLASARESAEKRAYSLENFEEMKKALYNAFWGRHLVLSCSRVLENLWSVFIFIAFTFSRYARQQSSDMRRIQGLQRRNLCE